MAKQVICFDIQFSAKLAKALDEKITLYSKEADVEEKEQNDMEIDVSFMFRFIPGIIFCS